jgi:ZIP family zinc transporter
MISISAFDLMPQAFAEAGTYVSLAALLAGSLATMAVDFVLPHVHHLASDRESSRFARTAMVIAAGIGMHDLPEGLAVGAGFGSTVSLGLRIAVLMFLHNVPEGMAVAAPLSAMKRSRKDMILWSASTGLPSVVGAAIGSALSVSPAILAFSLAFAAGAMLFVTFDELIPGASELAEGHAGTLGAVVGVIASIALSRVLSI